MGPKILWVIVLGFLAGVFLRSLFPLGSSFALFAALLGVAVLFLGVVEKRRLPTVVIITLALLAFAGGVHAHFRSRRYFHIWKCNFNGRCRCPCYCLVAHGDPLW